MVRRMCGLSHFWTFLVGGAALTASLFVPAAASASEMQNPIDRSDPSVLSREAAEEPPAAAKEQPMELLSPDRFQADVPDIAPFVVGAIRIEGSEALPAQAFAEAIEPYLGETASRERMSRLARDVADVARRAGYGLATAWIPRQRVTNGILRVTIDEGRIDRVEASGPAAEATEPLLRSLAHGRPVRTAELERQLLLARDMAGISVGEARLRRVQGQSVLMVNTRLSRVQGRYSLDNWGTSSVGPVRARLSLDLNGILETGDQLSLGVATTPLQPREFQLAHAQYSIPFGVRGTQAMVGGYLSRSEAGGSLRDRDYEGTSAEIEAGLSHPLLRSRERSLWGQVILGLRDSRLTRADNPVREDRIATVSASLYATAQVGSGRLRGRLALVQGLDILGANEEGDPLSSRSDADGTFTKLRFWSDYTTPLGAGFSLSVSGEGQLASKPLLASEEMGLGGRYFLRGYDYRERAGDQGAAGSIELRFDLADLPRPAKGAQLYLFADAGHVDDFRTGRGGGTLASAGGGVRLWLESRINAGIELGLPLRGTALDRDPGARLSLTLSGRF